jgi:phage baseplate assembly protein W
MPSIGLSFPFKDSTAGGIFKATQTTQEAIRSDLIALLTLKRGQRPMNNDLYSPLYDFIHETFDDITQESIKQSVTDKINLFFPELEIKDVVSTFDEINNLLHVKVVYSVPDLGGVQDIVAVAVVVENQQ